MRAAMERRRQSFAVHTFQADAFGLLAVPALAGFLQEVAGDHAEALGVGFEALRARGLAWVLGRQRIEILRPIQLGERLEVETWPSGADRLSALRDFVVRGARGEEVARSVTAWLLLDLERRRPARPDRLLEERLRHEQPHALAPPEGRLPEPAGGGEERRLDVRYEDIDQNLHVTNTRYLAWALEAVPEALWRSSRLASLEALYLAESRLGEQVVSRSAPAEGGGLLHAVSRAADGRELCRLRTGWVAR
jgi:acyl-ACP thioesterase